MKAILYNILSTFGVLVVVIGFAFAGDALITWAHDVAPHNEGQTLVLIAGAIAVFIGTVKTVNDKRKATS